MSEDKKYKLAPIKKIFSKKIKDPEGLSEKIIEISLNLGILTKDETEILLKVKRGEKIDLSKKEVNSILEKLLVKEIIELIEKE
jgi:hypothetical protein